MLSLSNQLEIIAFQLILDGWQAKEIAPLYEAAARLRAAHRVRRWEGWDDPALLRWIEGLGHPSLSHVKPRSQSDR
jgi:hypothetical protein